MYFIKRRSNIYHILDDEERGAAPEPCGTKMDKLDLVKHQTNKPTPNIMKEKPVDARLCKHCEKAEALNGLDYFESESFAHAFALK